MDMAATADNAYSNRYRAIKTEETSYLVEAREEELQDAIARNRELSVATNRRRRALVIKKKLEQQKEEKRRQEILTKRRERQREATEKFQRRNQNYKGRPSSAQQVVTVEDAMQAIRHPSPSPLPQWARQDSNNSNSCYMNFGLSSRSEAQTVPVSTNSKYVMYRGGNQGSSSAAINIRPSSAQLRETGQTLADVINSSQINLSSSRKLFEQQLHQQHQLLVDQQKKTLQQFNEALMQEMLNDKKLEGEEDDCDDDLIEDNASLSSKDSLDIDTNATKTENSKVNEVEDVIERPNIKLGNNDNCSRDNLAENSYGNISKINQNSSVSIPQSAVTRIPSATATAPASVPQVSEKTGSTVNQRVKEILNDVDLIGIRDEYSNRSNVNNNNSTATKRNNKKTDKCDSKTLKGILKYNSSSNSAEAVSVTGIGCHVIKKDNVRDSIDVNKRHLQAKAQKTRTKKVRKKSVRFVDIVYAESDDSDDSYEDIDVKEVESVENNEDPIPSAKVTSPVKETQQKTLSGPTTNSTSTNSCTTTSCAIVDNRQNLSSSKPPTNPVKNKDSTQKESLAPTPPRYAPNRPSRPVSARIVSRATNKESHSKPRVSSAPVTRRSPANKQYYDSAARPPIAVRNAFVDINVDGSRKPGDRNINGYDHHQAYGDGKMSEHDDTLDDTSLLELNNGGVRLDKTPTNDEINWLWNKVRTCLNRESQVNSVRSDPRSHRPVHPSHRTKRSTSATPTRGFNNYAVNGSAKVHSSPASQRTTSKDDSSIVLQNNISESMAAFLTAETLSNQSMAEMEINRVMDQAQRKQHIYNKLKHQNPSRDPTVLSVEEEQLLMSLERLNERLRINGTGYRPSNNKPQFQAWRPQSNNVHSIPANQYKPAAPVEENYTMKRPGINRPIYNKSPHVKGW